MHYPDLVPRLYTHPGYTSLYRTTVSCMSLLPPCMSLLPPCTSLVQASLYVTGPGFPDWSRLPSLVQASSTGPGFPKVSQRWSRLPEGVPKVVQEQESGLFLTLLLVTSRTRLPALRH